MEKQPTGVVGGAESAPVQSIIFDFDYTLADSSKGASDCVTYALRRMGLEAPPDEMIYRTIGLSLGDTYAALTDDGDPARAARFKELFVERAESTMAELTFLFDYVPAAIRALRQDGFALGIVSTKYRRRIQTILRREGLLELFDTIVGGEDVARHKPDPEGVLKAMETLNVAPDQSIYVGDSTVDAAVADRAGIRFVAVLSGTTGREAFKPFPVVETIDSILGLPGVLRGLRS